MRLKRPAAGDENCTMSNVVHGIAEGVPEACEHARSCHAANLRLACELAARLQQCPSVREDAVAAARAHLERGVPSGLVADALLASLVADRLP
jgi:hypothetical protein